MRTVFVGVAFLHLSCQAEASSAVSREGPGAIRFQHLADRLYSMPPKGNKSRRVEQDTQSIVNHINAVAESEHRIILNQIVMKLEGDKGLCQRLLFMMNSGAFDQVASSGDASVLSDSISKWRQLPQPVVKDLLISLFPNHADFITKTKNKLELLCFFLNTDPSSCIYSRSVPSLTARVQMRYGVQGVPWALHTNGKTIDWQQCGYFSLEHEGDQQFLKYIRGGRAALPAALNIQGWSIENNHSYTRASLKASLMSIPCLQVFQEVGADLDEVPEMLGAVPDVPAVAAGVSPASSAGSPASVRSGSSP